MHYFPTTLAECQSAIQEMWQTFTTTQPGQLEVGHGGNWTVSAHGNGRWYRDSSYYFNCGVNEEQEEGQTDPVNAVPFDQQRGTLAQNTMDELVQWFNTNYGDQPRQRPGRGAEVQLHRRRQRPRVQLPPRSRLSGSHRRPRLSFPRAPSRHLDHRGEPRDADQETRGLVPYTGDLARPRPRTIMVESA
jgi:hypothetical protein